MDFKSVFSYMAAFNVFHVSLSILLHGGGSDQHRTGYGRKLCGGGKPTRAYVSFVLLLLLLLCTEENIIAVVVVVAAAVVVAVAVSFCGCCGVVVVRAK